MLLFVQSPATVRFALNQLFFREQKFNHVAFPTHQGAPKDVAQLRWRRCWNSLDNFRVRTGALDV